jgi:hypothetical protein
MAGRNRWWLPLCGARTRAGGHCKARVVVGPTGPRSRCRMHGGADGSGQQTAEGRKRIGAATKARMLAFWQAYRDAGRPPPALMARKLTYGHAKGKAAIAGGMASRQTTARPRLAGPDEMVEIRLAGGISG